MYFTYLHLEGSISRMFQLVFSFFLGSGLKSGGESRGREGAVSISSSGFTGGRRFGHRGGSVQKWKWDCPDLFWEGTRHLESDFQDMFLFWFGGLVSTFQAQAERTMKEASQCTQHEGVGFLLTDVRPSLKPAELPDEELPMYKAFLSSDEDEQVLNHSLVQLCDQLPFRDSFESRTVYDLEDPAERPNGLTHETYVGYLEQTLEALQHRPGARSKLLRLVRKHRGDGSARRVRELRDWLLGRLGYHEDTVAP